MKSYWIKTPNWLSRILGAYEWKKTVSDKTVYITFDDGPNKEITPWVLEKLAQYDMKATFFCIGDNIRKNPEVFQRLHQEGHAIGNHTFHHVNGWKTPHDEYLKEIALCEDWLKTADIDRPKLMRPPYGKMGFRQTKSVKKLGYRIIMWDILSADFDATISTNQCLNNVIKHIEPGSIIIFHDSKKAQKNMEYALVGTLEYLQKNGYRSAALY